MVADAISVGSVFDWRHMRLSWIATFATDEMMGMLSFQIYITTKVSLLYLNDSTAWEYVNRKWPICRPLVSSLWKWLDHWFRNNVVSWWATSSKGYLVSYCSISVSFDMSKKYWRFKARRGISAPWLRGITWFQKRHIFYHGELVSVWVDCGIFLVSEVFDVIDWLVQFFRSERIIFRISSERIWGW